MKTVVALVSLFILSSFPSTKGLQIDDVEDVDIIYDDLIDELVAGRAELAGIDVSDYLRDGISDDMETDNLTDLPENLQQLQQQLLQVRYSRLKRSIHRFSLASLQNFSISTNILRPQENL